MAKFLERLQNAEEGTKRWIMLTTSAVAGVFVIWIWLGYFNNIVSPVSVTPTVSDSNISFAETAKGTLAIVGNALLGTAKYLEDLAKAPRSIDIQPTN